jgi:hypothetical protein
MLAAAGLGFAPVDIGALSANKIPRVTKFPGYICGAEAASIWRGNAFARKPGTPEVNQHTMFAVAGPMLKTTDAAMAYVLTGERRYADLVRKESGAAPNCGSSW